MNKCTTTGNDSVSEIRTLIYFGSVGPVDEGEATPFSWAGSCVAFASMSVRLIIDRQIRHFSVIELHVETGHIYEVTPAMPRWLDNRRLTSVGSVSLELQ